MASVPLAAGGVPLTLTLSPGGRGKRVPNRGAGPARVAEVERLRQALPLPPGEWAGVRGQRPC